MPWTPPGDWKSSRLVNIAYLLDNPDVTLDDVLSAFTEQDLIMELIKRGVLPESIELVTRFKREAHQ